MRNLMSGLTLAAAIAATCAPASAAELVQNGAFDGGLASWSVVPGIAAPNTKPDIIASTGSDYVTFVGGGSAPTTASASNIFAVFGMQQQENLSTLFSNTFQTVAGQAYSFKFDYGQFADVSGPQVIQFAVDGLVGNIPSPNVSTDLSTIFQSYSYSFTGSGAATQVAFTLAPSPTFNNDGLLDNVSVTTIPELGTWGMFFLGFGAIGSAYRRRRTQLAFA